MFAFLRHAILQFILTYVASNRLSKRLCNSSPMKRLAHGFDFLRGGYGVRDACNHRGRTSSAA